MTVSLYVFSSREMEEFDVAPQTSSHSLRIRVADFLNKTCAVDDLYFHNRPHEPPDSLEDGMTLVEAGVVPNTVMTVSCRVLPLSKASSSGGMSEIEVAQVLSLAESAPDRMTT